MIAGGHSIVDSEPKFGLFVTGLLHSDKIIDNAGATKADYLVLTKKIETGVLTTASKRGYLSAIASNEAVTSITTLDSATASTMSSHNVKATTDVTGFWLPGHLGNMLKASSVASKTALRANLPYLKIPLFEGVESLLEQGSCPNGTRQSGSANRVFCQYKFKLATSGSRCTDVRRSTYVSARGPS